MNSHRAVVNSSEHSNTTPVDAQWPSPEQFSRYRENFSASKNLSPPILGFAQTNPLNMQCRVHPRGAWCVRYAAQTLTDAQTRSASANSADDAGRRFPSHIWLQISPTLSPSSATLNNSGKRGGLGGAESRERATQGISTHAVNGIDLTYGHCRYQSLDLNFSNPHWDRGKGEPVLICPGRSPEPCASAGSPPWHDKEGSSFGCHFFQRGSQTSGREGLELSWRSLGLVTASMMTLWPLWKNLLSPQAGKVQHLWLLYPETLTQTSKVPAWGSLWKMNNTTQILMGHKGKRQKMWGSYWYLTLAFQK